jgi:hypothetical protein
MLVIMTFCDTLRDKYFGVMVINSVGIVSQSFVMPSFLQSVV